MYVGGVPREWECGTICFAAYDVRCMAQVSTFGGGVCVSIPDAAMPISRHPAVINSTLLVNVLGGTVNVQMGTLPSHAVRTESRTKEMRDAIAEIMQIKTSATLMTGKEQLQQLRGGQSIRSCVRVCETLPVVSPLLLPMLPSLSNCE